MDSRKYAGSLEDWFTYLHTFCGLIWCPECVPFESIAQLTLEAESAVFAEWAEACDPAQYDAAHAGY